MRYVALLRGINVGGKAKVEMTRLKAVFEKAGATEVSTYINSGNVLFTDSRQPNELVTLIESSIESEFGFKVPIVLRTANQIKTLIESIPSEWTNDTVQRTDVMFLWDEIDNENILQAVHSNPEIERTMYVPGALIWNIGRQNVMRGSAIKLVNTSLYKQMTIRNINTVRKIQTLL